MLSYIGSDIEGSYISRVPLSWNDPLGFSWSPTDCTLDIMEL